MIGKKQIPKLQSSSMTNCEVCGKELEDTEIEPACESCDQDGCCADCMSAHLETHLEQPS